MKRLEIVDLSTIDLAKLRADSSPFDAADHLDTAADIADFLNDMFEHGEADDIAHALGVVARSKGMREVAERAGLNEKSLYRSLSANGNPRLDTLVKVLGALGLTLRAEQRREPA